MKKLEQKNGRNWLRFLIIDDGIEYEQNSHSVYSHKKLNFDDIGFLKTDYDILEELESPSQIRPLHIYILGIFLFFLIISATQDPNTKAANTAGTLMIFVVFLGSIIAAFMVRNRRVKFKKIYFVNGSFCAFYYRNQPEIDQVEEFIQHIDRSIIEHSKSKFLVAVKDEHYHPEDLRWWLNGLNKRDAFSNEDYQKHLENINQLVEKRSNK